MKLRSMMRLICVLMLISGLGLMNYVSWNVVPPIITDPFQTTPAKEEKGQSISELCSFTVDITGLEENLDGLKADERGDQLADWAVLGTVLQGGTPLKDIRAALYDRAPVRDPMLDETFQHEYGPGRRLIMADGEAWLFYPDHKTGQRRPILGRLADKVRMELGATPEQFKIFRYDSDTQRGEIRVHREKDLTRDELFSARYGYVEKNIEKEADFKQWLDEVDDLTHVSRKGDGIVLGGRRFPSARTKGVNLDDVATLYQAHIALKDQSEAIVRGITRASQPLENAYTALLETYNAQVNKFNMYNQTLLDRVKLRKCVDKVLQELETDQEIVALEYAASSLVESLTNFNKSNSLKNILDPYKLGSGNSDSLEKHVAALLKNSTDDNKELLDQYASRINSLGPKVKKKIRQLSDERYKAYAKAGKIPPAEPGFSLDPQWDVPGFIADLELLLDNPAVLLERAGALSEKSVDYPDSARPVEVSRAASLVSLANRFSNYKVPHHSRTKIKRIIDGVAGKTGMEAEEGALLPYHQLKDELSKSERDEAGLLLSFFRFLEARHRVQCARYDGPLQGTHVGMVLFYTDLLAKLWVSVDYYHSAPTGEVFGFISKPRNGDVEATYWDEVWRLPATRLWFGTKQEGFAVDNLSTSHDSSESGAINFSHIATRVYAAGSNDLNPGVEEWPSEASRRAFGWWDRHYAKVADYEQQYHVQNQIMKWSMVTSWLHERDTFSFLKETGVDRSHRFDKWYLDNKDKLRFSQDVRILPKNRWLNGTEALESLQSYTFNSWGSFGAYISGGVSLGSSGSLAKGTRITTKVPKSLRRAGLDYQNTDNNILQNLKETSIELRPGRKIGDLSVNYKPKQGTPLRSGPSSLNVENISLDFRGGSAGKEITLRTDAGELGSLISRGRGKNLQLSWRKGTLQTDKAALAEVLQASRKWARGLKHKIPVGEDLIPTNGRYVVENNGHYQVLIDKDSSGGGRLLSVNKAGEGSADGFMRASLLDSIGFRGRELIDGSVKTVKAGFDFELLNSAPWQRLRPLPGEADGFLAGRLERVFTYEAPTGKLIELETGNEAMPRVQAMIDGDAIYLKRSSKVPPDVFNDLVVNEGLSARDLTRILGQGDKGLVPLVVVADRTITAMSDRSTQSLVQGDLGSVLENMARAHAKGNLKTAVDGMRINSMEQSLKRLSNGKSTPESAHFARAGLSPNAANDQMVQLLHHFRFGRLDKGIEVVKTMGAKGMPSEEILNIGSEGLRKEGQGSVADYLEVTCGRLGDVSSEMIGNTSLQLQGKKIITVTKILGGTFKEINLAERARGIWKEADIYVEDMKALSKLDWDANPGGTLATLAMNPKYLFEMLEIDGLGSFRPTRLAVDGKTSSIRWTRTTPTSAARILRVRYANGPDSGDDNEPKAQVCP